MIIIKLYSFSLVSYFIVHLFPSFLVFYSLNVLLFLIKKRTPNNILCILLGTFSPFTFNIFRSISTTSNVLSFCPNSSLVFVPFRSIMICYFLSSLEVILKYIISISTLTHYKFNQHLYWLPGQCKDLRIPWLQWKPPKLYDCIIF